MANYVSNKVICTKKFFNKYFLDPYALGKEKYEYCKKQKYISFNKLYGVEDVIKYSEKYGEHVDYGYFYTTKEIEDNLIEVKFKTRHYYPICAITKAIELDHSIIWYAFEENIIYISKFVWENEQIIEKTLNIETDDFNEWYDKNITYGNTYQDIDDSDDTVWYYDYDNRNDWISWNSNDLISRYKEIYPASLYNNWYENN